MQPCIINQERLGQSSHSPKILSTAPVKNNEYKHTVFLDEDAFANPELVAWPAKNSPISASLTLTGSWQPENQILPHMKIKVKFPLTTNNPETVFNRECVQATSHTAEIQFYPGKFDCFISDMTPEQLHHAQHNIWGSKAPAGIVMKLVRRQEYPARDYLFRVDWPVPTMPSAFAEMFTEQFRSIAHKTTIIIMAPRVRSHWIDS